MSTNESKNTRRDLYEILGVERRATESEIKKAFRKLSLQLHPDKNPSESAAAAFKRVSDAFTVVGDTYERAEYDANLDNGDAAADLVTLARLTTHAPIQCWEGVRLRGAGCSRCTMP